MTKKDYIRISEVINRVLWMDATDPLTASKFIFGLAAALKDDNPNFDAERFYAACTKEKKA